MAAQSEEYKVQTLFQDCSTLHPAHSTLQYEGVREGVRHVAAFKKYPNIKKSLKVSLLLISQVSYFGE